MPGHFHPESSRDDRTRRKDRIRGTACHRPGAERIVHTHTVTGRSAGSGAEIDTDLVTAIRIRRQIYTRIGITSTLRIAPQDQTLIAHKHETAPGLNNSV